MEDKKTDSIVFRLHSCIKHIEIDVHFVREKVEKGEERKQKKLRRNTKKERVFTE